VANCVVEAFRADLRPAEPRHSLDTRVVSSQGLIGEAVEHRGCLGDWPPCLIDVAEAVLGQRQRTEGSDPDHSIAFRRERSSGPRARRRPVRIKEPRERDFALQLGRLSRVLVRQPRELVLQQPAR
jgi:hypothetical protein